jgi:hypothetical protein
VTLDDAVAEALRRIERNPSDQLAQWVASTFSLSVARMRIDNRDGIPDVIGWGHDVVEIGETMTGSWDAEDALAIAATVILRAEDARDEMIRSMTGGES